jgi:hypothetical protein
MSEQNKTEATETASASVSKAASILDEVNGLVKTSGDEVRRRVVSALAEKVINENVRLVQTGLDKRTEALGGLRKVSKPDVETYDAAGNKLEVMSQAKFEEVKKAKENLEKVEKALAKALEENDYSKLKELCK